MSLGFDRWLTNLKDFVSQNKPSILTAGACAGFAVTIIFSSYAGAKSQREISEEEKKGEVSKKRKFIIVAKNHIPVIAGSAFTLYAGIKSNVVSSKRLAVTQAAYAATNDLYERYKAKVKERLGEAKEKDIRGECQDDVLKNKKLPTCAGQTTIISGSPVYWCYEPYTKQFFKSNETLVQKAINQINLKLQQEMDVCFDDYLECLDPNLKSWCVGDTDLGQEMGWNIDQGLLTFTGHYFGREETGEPYMTIVLDIEPRMNYRWKYY